MKRLFGLLAILILCSGAAQSNKVDALLEEARQSHSAKESYALIARALALDPKSVQAYILRAAVKLTDKDYKGTIADCSKVLTLKPLKPFDRYSALNFRYHTYIELHDYEKALSDCVQALNSEHSPEAARDAALLSKKLGKSGDYVKYSRLANEYVNSPRTQAKRMLQEMLDPTKVDAILAQLNTRLAKDPNDVAGLALRSVCYETKQQWDQALNDLSKLIKLKPEKAWHLSLHRATILMQVHRNREAAQEFAKVLALPPPPPSTLYQGEWISLDEIRSRRGICLREIGDYDEAIKNYTAALKFDPDEEESYRYRGDCYAAKHQYSLAIADYSKAIKLDTQSAGSTYLARAEVYEKLGEPAKANLDRQQAKKLGFDLSHPKTKYTSGNMDMDAKGFMELITPTR